MPSMTLSIPEELHSLIKQHNEIRWSEIARRAMWEYARKLEEADRLARKSRLTPEDAAEIGKKVKRAIHEHYKEK